MTNEQINIAIAEECGWTKVFSDEWGPLRGLKSGDKFYTGCAFTIVPDYCNDLNAMHDAEKALNPIKASEYARMLTSIAWESEQPVFAPMTATARQRAEEFLRTLGKWKEETK
jgi:hypothetical protein